MKKDYMKPVLMVVALRRALVLTGSPGAKDKMGMTDVQFSRKRHWYDDDDDY